MSKVLDQSTKPLPGDRLVPGWSERSARLRVPGVPKALYFKFPSFLCYLFLFPFFKAFSFLPISFPLRPNKNGKYVSNIQHCGMCEVVTKQQCKLLFCHFGIEHSTAAEAVE